MMTSDKIATLGHAGVVTANGHHTSLITPHPHLAELEDAEVLVLVTYSHLTVKHWPLAIQLNPDGKYKKKWT